MNNLVATCFYMKVSLTTICCRSRFKWQTFITMPLPFIELLYSTNDLKVSHGFNVHHIKRRCDESCFITGRRCLKLSSSLVTGCTLHMHQSSAKRALTPRQKIPANALLAVSRHVKLYIPLIPTFKINHWKVTGNGFNSSRLTSYSWVVAKGKRL